MKSMAQTVGPYCEALRFATSLRNLPDRHPHRVHPDCEALRFATSLRIVTNNGYPASNKNCEALRFATSLRMPPLILPEVTAPIAKLYASQLH